MHKVLELKSRIKFTITSPVLCRLPLLPHIFPIPFTQATILNWKKNHKTLFSHSKIWSRNWVWLERWWKRNSVGQKLKGNDFTQGNVNSQNQKRNQRKKRSMWECSVKNAGRMPKPKEPQAGIDIRVQTELVRWKQEQAWQSVIIFDHGRRKE